MAITVASVLSAEEAEAVGAAVDARAVLAMREQMRAAVEAARAKQGARRSGYFAGVVKAIDAHLMRGKDGGR